MAVGATDTWSQSRDEIIADALANVGAIGPDADGDISGPMRAHASRALNRIAKALDATGQFLWRISRATVTTTSGTASHTLVATAYDVDGPMDYKPASSATRTPIWPMSRDEYMGISDRTTSGTPSRYYLEKALSGDGVSVMTAYFWPVPDTTGDTIEYAAFLRAKDYTSGAITSDFPTNWIKCLVYGLTAEIAPTYHQPGMVAQYTALFQAERDLQLGADNEKQGLVFVPFGGSYG